MKLIIDIPNIIQDKIFDIANSGDDIPSGIEAQLVKAIINAISISDNATNGDMIKALFSDIKINRGKVNVYTAIPFGDYVGANIDAMKDWWNALYKRGETDE